MSRVGEGLIFHQHLPQAPKQQILAVEVGAVARRPFGPLGAERRRVPVSSGPVGRHRRSQRQSQRCSREAEGEGRLTQEDVKG